MRRFVLIAAVATLSACSQETEQPSEPAAIETPEPAAMGQGPSGTYDLKRYNGGTSTIVISADGTYTDTAPDGSMIGSGGFALKDGKYCFDPESDQGEDAQVCWTVNPPDASGSFTATDPSGHIVTLKRRAGPAAPAPSETARM